MAGCSVLPSAPLMGCQEACGTGLTVQDEVQDRDLRHRFSILVLSHEFWWYGKHCFHS